MSFTFWAYGLLAASIAVVVSSAELLTRYQAQSLREIFLSGYYYTFAALNGLFCFLVYWALPLLGNVAIKSDLLPSVQQPLSRAIIAGLGYLLIARTSVLDITVKGETRGVGLDIVYQTVANYLLRHHRRHLSERLRNNFRKVYAKDPYDPIVFLATAEFLLTTVEGIEKQTIQEKLQLALAGEPPPSELCLSLYIIILSMTSHNDAATEIANRREEIQNDTNLENSLKKRLNWLYAV